MMNSYDSLKETISAWLARQDLSPRVGDFITLAESRINRALRVRQMSCTVTTDVTGTEVGLPKDYLSMRYLHIENGLPLKLVSPDVMQEKKAINCTGNPTYYLEVGRRIEVFPAGDATPIRMTYYAKVPSLSSSVQTNWLLDVSPDVYLYGALLEASPYLKDDTRTQIWAEMYANAIEEIKSTDKLDRWSGSGMRVALG